MSHQLKLFVLDRAQVDLLLHGRARLRNLPADGQIVAAAPQGRGLGFTVYSASYPHADPRDPLPVVTALLERL
jgi:hypothetical protein